MFKIILYFSELHPDSPEGQAIWDELNHIRNNQKGGQYFVILEEFTKYALEENAIEIYRKQLKEKAE